MESLEDYMEDRIKSGLIRADGHPIKCECGCTKFKSVDEVYGEPLLLEYSLKCTNEKCLQIVGSWAYGHWQI